MNHAERIQEFHPNFQDVTSDCEVLRKPPHSLSRLQKLISASTIYLAREPP